MPEHCQMAVLMDFNRGLDDLYGSGRREANVKDMVDSPLPQQMNSSSDKAMAYALSSSSKEFEAGALPSRSGQVKVEKIRKSSAPSLPDDFQDASQTKVDKSVGKRGLSDDEINHLRSDLKDIASDELCNKFITNMLETLKTSGSAGYETTDIFNLFEDIFTNENSQISWDNITAFGTAGTSNVNGKQYPRITLQLEHFGVERGLLGSDKRGHAFVANTVGTFIHEMIHAYAKQGAFGHDSMAEAARSIAVRLFGKADDLPKKEDYGSYKDFDKAMSKYYGDVYWKACYRGWNGKRK